MRYFFILLFTLNGLFSFGQNKEEYYQTFFEHINNGDLEKSKEYGEKYLKLFEVDTATADVAFYMAYIYFNQGDYENAVVVSEKEVEIRKELQGTSHASYLNAIYYLSIYYSYTGNYDKAIPPLEEFYASVEKDFEPSDFNRIGVSNTLASFYGMAGAVFKAESIYRDNYVLVTRSYSPTDSAYQVMTNAIATFYLTNGIYDKAIPFYVNACALQEQYYGKESNEYMASYNSLGEMYIYAGMYDKAEVVYLDFVKLSEKFYGKKSADYATALNNLAVSYEKQEKLKEAEKTYLKCLEIKEKVFKKESDYYALSLVNLGVVYDKLGQYEKAEKTMLEALHIYENFYEGDYDNYLTALNNMASVYSSRGKNELAITLLEKAMETNAKKYGNTSKPYLLALNNLCSILNSMGETAVALKKYEEALPLFEKAYGKNHTDYGVVLFNIAQIHFFQGKYDSCITILNEDLLIQEKSVGKIHSAYANALQLKASVLAAQGKTFLAEQTYLEVGEIYTLLVGKMHPEYAVFLNNYGLFLFNKGDYHQSEKILNDAWGIQANAVGADHPDNISLLCNIANVQIEKNNFAEASKNLNQAFEMVKTYFKPVHPDYAAIINNIGTLYYHLGNYPQAEKFWLEALPLRKNIYGENHTEYAISLNNLGTLYLAKASATDKNEEMLKYTDMAIPYFKDALKVDSIALGANHPERASHYNNLAEAYRLRGEFEKAEKNYLACIALENKNYGQDNSKSAITYHNLALLYSGANDFDKGEEYAKRSLYIFEKNYGNNSSASSGVTASLAFINESKKEWDKAGKNYLSALNSQRKLLEDNFTFLSESEKEHYVASVSLYNDMFTSFVMKVKIIKPEFTGDVYNNEIYNKGLLFRSSSRMRDMILESKDETLLNDYDRWIAMKQELSVLYATPEAERKTNPLFIEEHANELEKKLVGQSAEILQNIKSKNVTWKDIQSQLKPEQAAVEFIRFMKNDAYKEIYYGALVLQKKDAAPIMISLFKEKDLDALMQQNAGTNYESIQNFYGTKAKLNDSLYDLIWKKLDSSLLNVKEIYIAPIGLLHKISLAALGKNGKYISDRFLLHQLTTTAEIMNKNSGVMTSPVSLALVGGVNYDSEETKTKVWTYLPGTLSETEHIKLVTEKSGIKTELLTAELATEEKIKKMDGEASPEILHIATHGFFFGDPQEQKEKIEKKISAVKFRGEARGVKTFIENPNPLMRSGIVLAGANNVWSEKEIKGEDGILTAYEVSLMNLKKTKLVVLSACETGLGDIKGSEGVYGLQRAFRIAGAEKMIMSLWQVPDKETDEFMTLFYQELTKNKNIQNAFLKAQQEMRKKYDPFFWGAFVLIE